METFTRQPCGSAVLTRVAKVATNALRWNSSPEIPDLDSRFLPKQDSTRSKSMDDQADFERELADGELLVREVDGFTQEVRTNRHRLNADEPEALGGQDSGMNPYELLLAALGTCTSMTMRMYAQHKAWPLTGIVVKLRHHQVHARDCAECESDTGKISVIEKSIRVAGDLSAEQVARLREIADRCPVHRTLMNEKKIATEISLD